MKSKIDQAKITLKTINSIVYSTSIKNSNVTLFTNKDINTYDQADEALRAGRKINHLFQEISRSLMRNPNKELLEQFRFLHNAAGKYIKQLSEKSLTKLLTLEEGRAGLYENKIGEDGKKNVSIEKICKYFEENPKNIINSKLIARTEYFNTALGYAATNIGKLRQEYPELAELLEEIVIPCMVPSINDYYTDKKREEICNPNDNNYHSTDIIKAIPKEYITDLSDAEDEACKQSRGYHRSRMFLSTLDGKETFIKKALNINMLVRGHISGSMPLTLASISGLYNIEHNSSLEEFLIPIATLISCAYHRADYHYPWESIGGAVYFQEATNNKLHPEIKIRILKPDEITKILLNTLPSIAGDQKLEETISIICKETIPSLMRKQHELNEDPKQEMKKSIIDIK